MENKLAPAENNNNQNLPANVAGAGGGTLLLLLAQNLPETNEYRSWLIIVAPSITVAIVAIWKWATKKIDNYWKFRKIESLKEKLRKDIDKAIKNPNFPTDQIDDLRRKLAELELTAIEDLMKAIKTIDVSYQ
jgi:hypothetical protein